MIQKIRSVKDEKGITLISVVMAVIIMLIITGMLIYQSNNNIEIKALTNMKNDIELLDGKIKVYYSKYGNIPKLQEYTNTDMIINNASIKNPNDGDKYYVIDLTSLENVSLNYGKDFENITTNTELTDVYIINEKSQTIYYPKGVEVDGSMYYRIPGEYTEIIQ